MTQSEHSRALNEARDVWHASNTLWTQVLLAAVAIGLLSSSWLAGAGALVFLGVILAVPVLGTVLAVAFALVWAGIGWLIGAELFGSSDAGYALAALGLLAGLGTNLTGLEYWN